MKKLFVVAAICISTVFAFAQKKLIPVTQSVLTGISLPAGTLQDKRIFSAGAATMLLESESKKMNISVSYTEVLTIPISVSGVFSEEVLHKGLAAQGFVISTIQNAPKYTILKKGEQLVVMYFDAGKSEYNLYFGKASYAAVEKSAVNNTYTQQVVNAENNRQPSNATTISQNNPVGNVQQAAKSANQAAKIGFAFTTTNFDDGWIANEQADWIQVSKGSTVVRIHYAQPNIKGFNNLDESTSFVWNTLVAPRYSNAANLWIRKSWWNDGGFMDAKYYAESEVTENATGKKVFVALFKNGSPGKWIEFITPDKAAFQNQFSVIYQQDGTVWNRLSVMENYNKFAVAASDLTGKWTSDFSGAIQYVNAYTGFDTGMNTNSATEKFQFEPGNKYRWDLAVASGMVGNIKYQGSKSSGEFSLPNNWQIKFSEIDGRPRSYNAHFACIKGLRILWLQDVATGDYKGYAKVE